MKTRKKRKPTYEVLTWDMDRQQFTPQVGVRRGPYTLWGLRRALRKLQGCGYTCDYRSHDCTGDPAVSIERRYTAHELAALTRKLRRAMKAGHRD